MKKKYFKVKKIVLFLNRTNLSISYNAVTISSIQILKDDSVFKMKNSSEYVYEGLGLKDNNINVEVLAPLKPYANMANYAFARALSNEGTYLSGSTNANTDYQFTLTFSEAFKAETFRFLPYGNVITRDWCPKSRVVVYDDENNVVADETFAYTTNALARENEYNEVNLFEMVDDNVVIDSDYDDSIKAEVENELDIQDKSTQQESNASQIQEPQQQEQAKENTNSQEKESPMDTQTNTTELNVSPLSFNMKVGDTQTLSIFTNALDFTIESSNPNVVNVSKVKKQIAGVGKGDANVTITAQVEGGELLTQVVKCKVTQNLDLSFGDEKEILENVYPYDYTLPLSVHGTIAYKKGDDDYSPLIKLVFDGKLQRWQVIGIKITKWNIDNEPYSIYYLATEGAVAQSLGNMSLEKVIVDMIDTLFIQEAPNMEKTITDLFDNTINPLMQTELDNVPLYVRNSITDEIEKIMNEKIATMLSENFDELVENKVIDKLKENVFGRIEPYHKEKDIPKWVGVILTEHPQNTTKNIEERYLSRRINTNGIEEEWLSLKDVRINDFTNNDELTKLFDSIEPYKSMDRMEIMYDDLKNIAGDSIYSKEIFERLMSQSLDKNNALWNGSFYSANETEIFNRESAWFIPIKKCHYIDVEFTINNDDKRYMLKAVGEKEFEVDIKDYFPNATSIKLNYIKCEKVGLKEFYVDETKIASVVHPSFLNYYDMQCNVMPYPLELDYIYVGAFNDVSTKTTDDFSGSGTLNWFLAPKPFANTYVKWLQMKQMTQQKAKYMFGMNPNIGVNMRHMSHNYQHLLMLMQTIERGDILASNIKGTSFGNSYKWKWQTFGESTIKTGYTWHLGNKTGFVMANTPNNNYRGIENFLGILYAYLEDVERQNGTKQIWFHLPHTHRFVPDLWNYDGINWINSGYANRDSNTSYAERIIANSCAVKEPLTNAGANTPMRCVSWDTEQMYRIGFLYANGGLNLVCFPFYPIANVYWSIASRSCI